MTDSITIPSDLLPSDGRFGSGPSRIRKESIDALVDSSTTYLGTSHRKPAVQNVIGELREALADFFQLPEGYEIVLANGGSTVFWDVSVQSLIAEQSEHLVFGEFSTRFSQFAAKAPHLKDPIIIKSDMGTHPEVEVRDDVDTYALIHNETSTGVCTEIKRPNASSDAVVLVDATSAAAGMPIDLKECDAYYFAPQKCFAADGGTWLAAVSPALIARAEAVRASGRYVPVTLDFLEHLENSRANTTYNTPSLATIMLTLQQTKWMNENGGIAFSTKRCKELSDKVYSWAETRDFTEPFVKDPAMRSPISCTIDFDEKIDYAVLGKHLRANGIVDVEGYRKLGRNQLRIATFPATEPSELDALLACIDYVVERMV